MPKKVTQNKTALAWMKEKSPFPSKLRAIMKERRITQEELSEFLGVSRQTISDYLRGQSVPNIYMADKIANYFNISILWLLSDMPLMVMVDMDSLHQICKQQGGEKLDSAVSLLFDLTGEGLTQALNYLQFLDSQKKYSIRAQEYEAETMLEECSNAND